jgi:predicted secreted protein
MAAVNGTLILVNDDGTAFAATTSATLNIEMDLPDASTKDSAGWAEHIQGQKSWSVDLDGIADFETSTGTVDILVDYLLSRTQATIEFEPASGAYTTAGVSYTGTASLASVSLVAANEDTATLSGSFTGDGALTRVAVS